MLNKIDVIKEELNKYEIAFAGFNEDLEKYKILGEQEKIKDTNKMIQHCANKIVHYTAILYKEKHGDAEIDLKAIQDDTTKVIENLNKSINDMNKTLDKINDTLDKF